MANSVGGIIEAVDYNSIRNKVIAVLGSGSGASGYGQDARIQSGRVSSGFVVGAAQWSNLRFDIFNCLVHQNGTNPTIVQISTGDVVRYGAAHPNNAYDTLADTITTNRFNLGTGRFSTEALSNTNSGDITWYSTCYVDVTYTFNNANEARYFFNSGGQLRVSSSFTPSVTKAQTTSWASLLASAGSRGLGGQIPSSGFSPMDGTNFYRLTSSLQTYYTISASSPYSANNYRLQARCNVSNNAAGTANIVVIRVLFTDAYVDPPLGGSGAFPPEDSVNGTLTVSTDMIKPGGTMQPAPAAGNFTVKGPNSAGGGSTSFGSFIYDTSPPPPPPLPPPPPPPPPPPLTYNETISIAPTTFVGPYPITFLGNIINGVPFTSFTLTYTNRNTGAVLLSGSASLNGSGAYSASGTWSITGQFRLTVVFAGSGNTRSLDFNAI